MATSALQSNNVYVDFGVNFDFHPIRKDLALVSNESAVKRSIVNLVKTKYYERLDPTIGGNINGQLFELATPQTQIILQSDIEKVIKNHEPRANLISVVVAISPDTHEASATITFAILNNPVPVTVTVLLERTR